MKTVNVTSKKLKTFKKLFVLSFCPME
jgi:hypothetical protein